MDHAALFDAFIFLAAACVIVPLVERLKLGSVLGYLLAGVLIGPFCLKLIENHLEIMHFAEFGVVMMLFLVGLELEPSALWRLRRSIFGLGALQVLLTTVVLTGIGMLLGYEFKLGIAVSMALALSATALVLQFMQEKGMMQTTVGENAFAVLLFQDIAVIPILLLLPLLAGGAAIAPTEGNLVTELPGWLRTMVIAGVITGIIVVGRYLSRYLFRFVARTNLREVFTATSLALVVGITLLMQSVGMSPALGAFIGGLVLANSEYRHTLVADIQPFKGLLLGLFFMAIGMGMDLKLLAAQPEQVFAVTGGLMLVKALILAFLGGIFGMHKAQNAWFSFGLAQGGEFTFVLIQVMGGGLHMLGEEQAAFLTLVTTLSIAATPFLLMINERFVVPRFMSLLPEKDYDAISESNPVIIAGYGRYGQIIGRFLRAQGIGVTVLEKDPEQIELLRKFGAPGYFGDASRLELLESAQAHKARLLIVAVDDADKCLEIVRLAREHFPKLVVYARARNRRHAYELHKAGANYFRRELFDSSLMMAQEAMKFMGGDAQAVETRAARFMAHDEKTLRSSFEFFEREPELISFQRQASGELERILQDDRGDEKVLPIKKTRAKKKA